MNASAGSISTPLVPLKAAFTIPLNALQDGTKEELLLKIARIAVHIREGHGFSIERQPLLQHKPTASHQELPTYRFMPLISQNATLSIPVLEALNKLLSKAIEIGISSKNNNLRTISSFCDKIIEAHPLSIDPMLLLPKETRALIFQDLTFQEVTGNLTVTSLWKQPSVQAQIALINSQSLPLKKILCANCTATQAVTWLINHPCRSDLHCADFTGFMDFDNNCLEVLTKNCPQIQHLLIPESQIKGDALQCLKYVPDLKTLNIAFSQQLEGEALDHLRHVPGLISLDLGSCYKLNADALEYLKHVPGLLVLDIGNCYQLGGDSLKHLRFVRDLQTLNIGSCHQLEADSLKHLMHVPNLISLDIGNCNKLEANALKHLQFVRCLKILDIGGCYHLETDALKHLVHVPNLQTLSIGCCYRLEEDALKHLMHVPCLLSLDIGFFDQLEADSLKYLNLVPGLLSLDISGCDQLESDALKHLIYVPNLQNLDIGNCKQLAPNVLKYLALVPKLLSLGLAFSEQLETDALKHLVHVPNLQNLDIYLCRQLNLAIIPVSPTGIKIVR